MRTCCNLLLALALGAFVLTTSQARSLDSLNLIIPDGDLTGSQSSQTLSGLGSSITHLSVTLNITGGFNGDLYIALLHNNASAVLLNRVGRSGSSGAGYPDSGLGANLALVPFTLDDQASRDVHWYRLSDFTLNAGALTGLWQPDGRALDPLSAGSAFDTAGRNNGLSVFNGMDPNGSWTLFAADVASGNESTLMGWGLQVTAIPEPGTAMLLGAGFAAAFLWRWPRRAVGRPC